MASKHVSLLVLLQGCCSVQVLLCLAVEARPRLVDAEARIVTAVLLELLQTAHFVTAVVEARLLAVVLEEVRAEVQALLDGYLVVVVVVVVAGLEPFVMGTHGG